MLQGNSIYTHNTTQSRKRNAGQTKFIQGIEIFFENTFFLFYTNSNVMRFLSTLGQALLILFSIFF